MRRQRTVSETGGANGSENELNDSQRIRESSDNDGFNDEIIHSDDQNDNTIGSDEDMESTELDDENSESESENNTYSDDDDDDDDMEYAAYEDEDEDEDGSDTEDVTNQLDIMNQLQSALLGMNSTAMNQTDLERLRQQITAAGGLFSSGPATHSNQIRSIIRSLPDSALKVDPMLLYSTFTELWEMIVLTGEEVEAFEFDTVVDLKPLLPHFLRVLRWDEDCQIYGSEFLLYAVRCTRACVQYSPGCARRLVESGLVPLITRQLFSVEYIDLAEDLIQIIQILSKSGVHSKACLHADGIRAVLGFVDFFALSVQVNAFTAAAQMTTALTDDTLHLYLPPETAALLRATIRRYIETDSQVLKLVHQATQALSNSIQAAPSHVDELCPWEFVHENIMPLASIHPLDSATLLLKLISISKSTPKQLATSAATVDFFKVLLKTAATSENLLETILKLLIDLFGHSTQKPLQELIGLCFRNRNLSEIAELEDLKNEIVLGQVSETLFEFYLNSPSISVSSRHSTLCTLLLLDDCQTVATINLVKMGALSRLLTTASSDPMLLIIGLEWCRVLSKQPEKFSSTAMRQGLHSELHNLLNTPKLSSTDESLKKWLEMRLKSVEKTVYSGEESESLQIYIKHFINEILSLTENNGELKTRNLKIVSVKELIELMKSEKFTEYEWLGDTETCLARQLYDLLAEKKIDSESDIEYKPICEAIYKALNRYDAFFTLNLPLAKLTRATSSNPLEALAILARPLRVHLSNTLFKSEKMVVCDPFASIGWIVKMGWCGEEERKLILRETGGNGDSELAVERVYDAIELEEVQENGYGIVDISSSAFTAKSLQVHLINPSSNNRILIPPSASLIEVLFDNMLQGTSGTEKWKRINEIWSGGAIKLVISKESKTKSENESEKEIERDNKILADKAVNTTPILTPTTATLTTSTITSTVSDNRVKLALNLLNLIPFKSSNDHLSSKLSKELDSPLLIAVNGISLHWIQTAQSYHFLYPFPLRLNLMKSVCMGRLRALWILQQRTSNSVELNSIVTLPRRKFRIHRDQFLQCMKKVFKSDNRGDLRLFEFEYAEELGTGHGPTMEFYALASQTISSISSISNNGLFPCWKKINDLEDQDWFRIIGSFVSRAWLDDRIIDVPINPIFLKSLLDQDLSLKFDNLKDIDQELYNSLKSNHNLIESDLNFLIPGTEICLLPRDKEIRTFEDAEEFKRLLLGRINERMIKGRDSFLQGFNQSFPCSFHDCIKYFTDSEVSRLFSQSLNSENSSDWTLSTVLSALVPDHGYTLASPQIRWLSEMIAETEGYDARGRLVRFLTGAAYLPIGGWKALRPPLTIVCKSDDVNVNASGMSNANSSIASSSSSSSNIAHNTLPTTSPTISSDSANHDYYLPSVMTCANYLKLPRYSSKEVMEEKFQYAIKEGSDSFHLS